MPRFFFPVRDSHHFPDHVGVELPDEVAARREAANRLHELLVRNDHLWDGTSEWRIDVLDESESVVATLVVVADRRKS